MPPKKKAKTVKKPSPAYLAELEKLKRTKRKKAVGNTYQIPYSDEDDEVGDEYWEFYILSSYDEIDMRTFEEEEEYFNNISKVKQELKDHPDRYERDIVWTFILSQKKGGVLSSDVPPLRFIYRNGFWGYNDGDVEIEGDVPDELGVERLEDFLCEKFQIGEESMSGGESGSEEEEEKEEEEEEDTNAWIIPAFEERAKEETNPHKRKAWENATTALDYLSLTIHSVEDVKNVKGVGKSSCAFLEELFKNRDEAPNEKEKAAKDFFDVVKSKGVRETVASLPKDADITVDTDGVLRVNGKINEYFHARGCPFELTIDCFTNDDTPQSETLTGKTWVVDGSMNYYHGNRTWSEFEGTLTHKKEVVSINYTSGCRDNLSNTGDKYVSIGSLVYTDERNVLREALEDKVFSLYEWNDNDDKAF